MAKKHTLHNEGVIDAERYAEMAKEQKLTEEFGRRMRIEKETKPGNSAGDPTMQYARKEILRYTARQRESRVHKEYVSINGKAVRREKFVNVSDVRFHQVPEFKSAEEMFVYLVENCGYRWVH